MANSSPEVLGPWTQKASAGLGYPPYQTEYEHPPPPSVANTIVSGRDVRRSRKPSRPRDPVAKPPLPRSVRDTKVKPPRTIDVNLEGQEWRADRKCYKKHTICLSERLDRLSRPRRRYIINQWRDYHNVLSPEQINTLHEMLCCEVPKSCKPFNPDQAYDFFKTMKPKKKKKKCCKKKCKQNKDLMLLCGDRGLSWARNATVALARGIQQRLGRPGCCVLMDSMQRLSDIILSEMAGYMGYKCRPSRYSNNPKTKFMVEMADKIAVWIDEIMSDAEARMLLMDFDDDEVTLFADRPWLLGDFGDGSGPIRGASDGKPVLGPGGKPLQAAFGPDGKHLIGPNGKPVYTTVGPDGKPMLVDADGKPILGPGGKPLQAALGSDGRPLMGPDGKPLYTTIGSDGKPMLVGADGKPVLGPGGKPLLVALGPDGQPLIGTDGKPLYTTIGPDGRPILVGADGKPTIGPDGKLMLDGKRRPLIGPDGKALYTTIGPDGKPMVVSADGKPIVGEDGIALPIALGSDGKPLQPAFGPDGKPLFGPDGKPLYVAVGPDGKPLAGSDGKPLYFTIGLDGKPVLVGADGKPVLGPGGKPLQAAFGPDGKHLIGPNGKPVYTTVGPDGKPMLVDADGKPILGPGGKPLQAALGSDGRPLMGPDGKPLYTTIGSDGKPMLVGADGKPVLGPGGKPLLVALGPDGQPLIGTDGKPLYTTIGPDGRPILVGADGKPTIGPDGKLMLDGKRILGPVAFGADGKPLQPALGPDGKPLLGPDGKPLYVAVGPDGKHLAGSDGKPLYFTIGLDGKPILVGADGKPVLGPGGKPLQAALGPDGKPLLGPDGKPLYTTVGPDGKPMLVSVDGKPILGPGGKPLQAVLGPDGRQLVGPDGKPLFTTIGKDGKSLLVGADGRPVIGPDGKPLQVALGSDGRFLIGPDGKPVYTTIGPDGKPMPVGENVKPIPDGKPLIGTDGKPLYTTTGPDGKPILGTSGKPLRVALGPNGKPLLGPDGKPLYTTIGPDGKPILVGADGKPILGPGGKPLQVALGPNGKPILGPDGKPLYTTIGPDGKPMLVGADGKPILGPDGKPLQPALGSDGRPFTVDADGRKLKFSKKKGDPKEDLISEMQKKFNEKLVDTPSSANRESSETYFYAAQRLKKAQLDQIPEGKTLNTPSQIQIARLRETREEQIKEKLEDCLKGLSVPRSEALAARELVPKAAKFLSREVEKPVPEIESFIAVLKKLDETRDEPLVTGKVPMTRGEVSDFLKSVPTYEDTINKQDPALKKQVKDQMLDIVKTLPPSQAYSKADMDKVIDLEAGLLTSYITHQQVKTRILDEIGDAMAQDPNAVILRHGLARRTNQDAVNALQGRNATQLRVPYHADDIVARKLRMNLDSIASRTGHISDPLMPEILDDLTDYLSYVFLHPTIERVCRCVKTVYVQCELWCEEILRRTASPCCECRRDTDPDAELDSPCSSRVGAYRPRVPGLEINVDMCPRRVTEPNGPRNPPCPASRGTLSPCDVSVSVTPSACACRDPHSARDHHSPCGIYSKPSTSEKCTSSPSQVRTGIRCQCSEPHSSRSPSPSKGRKELKDFDPKITRTLYFVETRKTQTSKTLFLKTGFHESHWPQPSWSNTSSSPSQVESSISESEENAIKSPSVSSQMFSPVCSHTKFVTICSCCRKRMFSPVGRETLRPTRYNARRSKKSPVRAVQLVESSETDSLWSSSRPSFFKLVSTELDSLETSSRPSALLAGMQLYKPSALGPRTTEPSVRRLRSLSPPMPRQWSSGSRVLKAKTTESPLRKQMPRSTARRQMPDSPTCRQRTGSPVRRQTLESPMYRQSPEKSVYSRIGSPGHRPRASSPARRQTPESHVYSQLGLPVYSQLESPAYVPTSETPGHRLRISSPTRSRTYESPVYRQSRETPACIQPGAPMYTPETPGHRPRASSPTRRRIPETPVYSQLGSPVYCQLESPAYVPTPENPGHRLRISSPTRSRTYESPVYRQSRETPACIQPVAPMYTPETSGHRPRASSPTRRRTPETPVYSQLGSPVYCQLELPTYMPKLEMPGHRPRASSPTRNRTYESPVYRQPSETPTCIQPGSPVFTPTPESLGHRPRSRSPTHRQTPETNAYSQLASPSNLPTLETPAYIQPGSSVYSELGLPVYTPTPETPAYIQPGSSEYRKLSESPVYGDPPESPLYPQPGHSSRARSPVRKACTSPPMVEKLWLLRQSVQRRARPAVNQVSSKRSQQLSLQPKPMPPLSRRVSPSIRRGRGPSPDVPASARPEFVPAERPFVNAGDSPPHLGSTVKTEQMQDLHSMLVSVVWNVRAWADWLRAALHSALNHTHGSDGKVLEEWKEYQTKMSEEALKWRNYNLFSKAMVKQIKKKYRQKRIVSPSRCTDRTLQYQKCQRGIEEVVDICGKWTKWVLGVLSETENIQPIPGVTLNQRCWEHFKRKVLENLHIWNKYHAYLKKYCQKHIQVMSECAMNCPVWVMSACGAVPSGAVPAGTRLGEPVWLARTTLNSKVLPAVMVPSLHGCLVHASDGKVHRNINYEVMCNARVSWVTCDRGTAQQLCETSDARIVLAAPGVHIGRVLYKGEHLVGAVPSTLEFCTVGINDLPCRIDKFELLVFSIDVPSSSDSSWLES